MIIKTFNLLNRKTNQFFAQHTKKLTKKNQCQFFNFNKGNNNEVQQPKGKGRRNQSKQSTLTPLDSIIFPFPFEWTLQANNFKYYDPRFTEQPIKKNLQQSQKEHIFYVLQNLERYLNSGGISPKSLNKFYSPQATKLYLHQNLSSKLEGFLQSLKSSEISIKIKIDRDSIDKTQGYMEMQAKNIDQTSSINFLSPKYIHEYNFERQKELLLIEEKKFKQKKSQEQLLKQDVNSMMDEKSKKKQVRQFFQQMQKGKNNDGQRAINFLKSKLKEIASRKPQKKRQEQKYATSQLIKGKVHFLVTYKNQLICDQQTDLYTKWVYVVEQNEPQSIRKSRKRILYDFQFWNRGAFFEVKDWTQQIGV